MSQPYIDVNIYIGEVTAYPTGWSTATKTEH